MVSQTNWTQTITWLPRESLKDAPNLMLWLFFSTWLLFQTQFVSRLTWDQAGHWDLGNLWKITKETSKECVNGDSRMKDLRKLTLCLQKSKSWQILNYKSIFYSKNNRTFRIRCILRNQKRHLKRPLKKCKNNQHQATAKNSVRSHVSQCLKTD